MYLVLRQAKGVRELLRQGDRRRGALQRLLGIAEKQQSQGCMGETQFPRIGAKRRQAVVLTGIVAGERLLQGVRDGSNAPR